jgi:hypothetical protein
MFSAYAVKYTNLTAGKTARNFEPKVRLRRSIRMKKKVFLAVALLALMAVGAFAQYTAESDFQVTKTATAVTITRYVGASAPSAVNIPPTIQNLPVTTIGGNIFTAIHQGVVTSLTIPASVTSIQSTAFYNLLNLRSVTFLGPIPSRGMNSQAFPGDLYNKFYATDTNGTPGTYTKSGNVWTLTSAAASATTSMAETPAASFEWSRTADGRGIIIEQYTGKEEAVRIPDRISNLPVVEIGMSAFEVEPGSGKTVITRVIIPNTVTKIGDRAFFSMRITSITLPTSLTTIGSSAFSQTDLTSVTLPASITTIGNSAFGCPHLTTVTIPASVTKITFGANAFRGAISLNAASKTALQRVGYTGTF